jgi:hypothetical protein
MGSFHGFEQGAYSLFIDISYLTYIQTIFLILDIEVAVVLQLSATVNLSILLYHTKRQSFYINT